jgi:hypothetical protein
MVKYETSDLKISIELKGVCLYIPPVEATIGIPTTISLQPDL